MSELRAEYAPAAGRDLARLEEGVGFDERQCLLHFRLFSVSRFRFSVQVILGSGFRVQGLGFKVQGSGSRFRVRGSGFRGGVADRRECLPHICL